MSKVKAQLDTANFVEQIAAYLKSQNTPSHYTDEQQARQLDIPVSTLRTIKQVYAQLKKD